MHSRTQSKSNQASSPIENVLNSPLSASGASSPLASTNSAAFTNLLPLSGIPINSQSEPAAHGPISGVHKLPPRPRPGRKADPNPAATKKGQSNRLAQQKHRQKKKQLEQQEIERQRRQAEETNRLMRQNAMLLHENKKLKQTRAESGPLSPALTTAISTSPDMTISMSPQTATLLPTSEPAPGGCGDCIEGGSCPCVDSLLEAQEDEGDRMDIDTSVTSPKRSIPRPQRQSFTIQSLLSPSVEEPDPMSRAASQRRVAPSQAQHDEHETDFTSAFRNDQSYDPALPTGLLTTCGGCPPDDASCLCRKANRVVGSDADSDISSVPQSRAASSAANDGPGSCARCQADPKQRAWCQGLALETLGSPVTSASDNGDANTDMKMSSIRYETISCAEAYSVQQRYIDSNQGSRSRPSPPMSAVDLLNSVRERPREYSAFEVDIGTVLSNLKHCKPRRQTDAR